MERVFRLEEIGDVAHEVMQLIGPARVISFEGELGAGKTTFIRSLCLGLGVTAIVSSPSFSIINEYPSPEGPVYHIDLYRCRSEDEVVRAGVEDCLYSGYRCLVEWPSRAEGIFPDDTVRVVIVQNGESSRKIIVHCKS